MKMRPALLFLLSCTLASFFSSAAAAAAASRNETAAQLWFIRVQEQQQRNLTASVEASWAFNTDMTDANAAKQLQARLQYSAFQLEKRNEMDAEFDWKNFQNPTLRRAFEKLADVGISIVKEESKLAEFNTLVADMTTITSQAVVVNPIDGKNISLESGIVALMRDPNVKESVKKALWWRLRDASGKPLLDKYERYVKLFNELIAEAGYSNVAKYWQSWYEPAQGEDFEEQMEQLWQEVRPMYEELHAYMRYKLKQHYGSDIFPPDGHIPGHILGHMWGGRWDDLESISKPFPQEQTSLDITQEMLKQGWTVRQIFETSEEFFASLGLGNMTDLFWRNSVIEQLPNVRMVCHASAWDFYTGRGDFRIKQCTKVDGYYLTVTHHEMGHIQYYQQYEKLPIVFRRGANPGFHEAVGDVIELSVMTPGHLNKIKLLDSVPDSAEFNINYLYLMALKKVAYLPFAYLVDKWRWQVFSGAPKSEYNRLWVKERCRLMGVCSPVWRKEDDFDPGSIYHIAANVPYVRYFISYVLQFQLHKALCNAAGITENIHKCSIYRNAAAGAKLKAMLEKGSSEHWQNILYEVSGSRTITAQPMIEYFKPLMDHIRSENAANKQLPGWKADCPSAEWYEKSASRHSALSLPMTLAAAAVAAAFAA